MPKTIICRSVTRLLLVILIVAVGSFCLLVVSPIDPVDAYLGYGQAVVSEAQKHQITQRWLLDLPAYERFFRWLSLFIQGDWGWSLTFNMPVREFIQERFFLSFLLLGPAWLLSTLLGMVLGISAGLSRYSRWDQWLCRLCWFKASMPGYWLAMLLLLFFSVYWPVFPAGGLAPPGMLDSEISAMVIVQHMVLPVIALTITSLPAVTLHCREKMLLLLDSNTVLYARAQGATWSDIAVYHGVTHTAIPVLTFQLASLGELFGGSILVEQVFSWPGLGEATIQAGLFGDVSLLLAIAVCTSLFVCAGNGLANILCRTLDVRTNGHSERKVVEAS